MDKNELDECIESPMVDFTIKRSEIKRWLEVIYRLSGGTESLDSAITLAKYGAMSDEEIEISNGMGLIYRAQCSGALIPPVKLNIIYRELIEEQKRRESA